ncbi:hypothetical protein, partial [Novosphingobium sp.]|uniref:hypothetical protein n=1 Tax=Novosphingobium sp. TaxID=1874826 RepID=UPI001D9E13D0
NGLMMAMMNFIHAPFAAFSPGDPPADEASQTPCQMSGALESGGFFSRLRKTTEEARSNLVQIPVAA